MILRLLIPYAVLTLVAFLFFDWRFWRKRGWLVRLLAFLPAVGLLAYIGVLSRERNYFPDDLSLLNVFLFLFGLTVVPMLAFALCWALGRVVGLLLRTRRNYGQPLGLLLSLCAIFTLIYGTFVGFGKLEVVHEELAFSDLPPAFDGYRIVFFSDAHVGTYVDGREEILQRAVDSIMAQQADMVVFAGDMQNMVPQEIERHATLLSKIKAPDGVFSVLGNHDYAEYTDLPYEVEYENQIRTIAVQERQLGWTVLVNARRYVRRGNDSIVIAGMENDGEGRFPQLGNLGNALYGVKRSDFIVMLEHDPSSWRRKILPKSHTQLTLSGHTHGMQFSLFGWSPMSLLGKECMGLYRIGDRALYVSKGLGGVIPFRFGATGEIVVIKLKKK